MSSRIVLMIRRGVVEVFTRNPDKQYKATKDRPLVAIVLRINELTEYLYQ